MPTRIKSIKLLPYEVKLLEKMYLKWRVPIEQFESRPEELAAYTDEWNKLSGRADLPGAVLHCMRTRRKTSKTSLWPKLGRNHTKVPKFEPFTAEEVEVLVELFKVNVADMCHGSDYLAYTFELVEIIAKEFADRTGRIRPANEILTKITQLRKRGILPETAKHIEADPDVGFLDIDQAEQAS